VNSIRRNKIAIACLAAAASLGLGARAKADTITADLVSENPFFEGAVLSLSSSSVSQDGDVIGQLNWVGSSSNAQPFNSTFNTYCLDLIDGIASATRTRLMSTGLEHRAAVVGGRPDGNGGGP